MPSGLAAFGLNTPAFRPDTAATLNPAPAAVAPPRTDDGSLLLPELTVEASSFAQYSFSPSFTPEQSSGFYSGLDEFESCGLSEFLGYDEGDSTGDSASDSSSGDE